MARQFLAAAFFALSAFKLGWLVVAPIFLAAEQRRSDAAEADLRRVCRARQPPWALWRRERLAAECSARALAELRGTQSFPPPSLVLKHQDFPSVLSTHHLGAAVWCGAGIAQFALRRNSAAERQRHRLVGRLHLLGVALLTAGFVQICRHDLHFDRDFRAAYADVPARDEREHRLGVLVLCGLQAWFVLTAGKAWAAARARRIDAHSAWMVRHVASGMWVVVMRALSLMANAAVFALGALGAEPPSGLVKMRIFAATAVAGTLISLSAGEMFARAAELS